MHSRHVFLVAAVSMIAMLLGCSGPGDDTAATPAPAGEGAASSAPVQVAQASADPPEVVAQKFIDAGNAGDQETFVSLLTEEARAGFGEDQELSGEDGFESYTIGETTIDGDHAQVAVEAMDAGQPLNVVVRMRQQNAAWRVFAMDMDLGDGLVMKMNFEELGSMLDSMAESMAESMGQSMEEAFSAAFETSEEQIASQRAEYEALEAVSEEDYAASWMNSTDYSGQPARAALTALAESIGLAPAFEDNEAVASGNVSVDVTGLSIADAIETIANEAGLYAIFPDPTYGGGLLDGMATALAEGLSALLEGSGISIEGAEAGMDSTEIPPNAVVFVSGERPTAVNFTGPFVVEVTDVTENAPNTTGSITIVVRAFGLEPSLLALLEGDSESTWFETVADSQGRPLVDTDVMYLGGGTSDGVSYADPYTLELRNLIREVETIASISGLQRLRRPTEIVELSFADASPGATAESGGFTGTLGGVDSYTELTVATPEGFDSDDVAALAIAEDGEGNPIAVSYVSTMSWQENQIDVSLNLDDVPAAVHVKLVAGLEVHEYPFAFSDLPLQQFSEQPEKVEELAFEGDAPVTVEFLEVTEPDDSFATIRVRVTNHSNKDAENISLNLVYLDGDGNEVDDFPAGLSPEYMFEDGEMTTKPAASKNSTAEVETTAFSMPAETQDVRVEVTMVEFLDGTEWTADW